jgi:CRISPR-associated protein Csm3
MKEAKMEKPILGKIIMMGTIECLTGLHIGASKENMEIGAIDAPVVRDPVTREPYIPGSSLKGKLRALLEKALAKTPNRNIGSDVKIHVCPNKGNAKECEVCRVFGSTGKKEGEQEGSNFPARLIVRDSYLDEDSLKKLSEIDTGLQYTEWKFENAIDRVTSAANPRQIERVPKGAEFRFEMVYNVEDKDQIEEDLKNLNLAIELLKLDSLGGHGSRGYGKVDVKFDCIKAMTVEHIKGDSPDGIKEVKSLEQINEIVNLFKNGSEEK